VQPSPLYQYDCRVWQYWLHSNWKCDNTHGPTNYFVFIQEDRKSTNKMLFKSFRMHWVICKEMEKSTLYVQKKSTDTSITFSIIVKVLDRKSWHWYKNFDSLTLEKTLRLCTYESCQWVDHRPEVTNESISMATERE